MSETVLRATRESDLPASASSGSEPTGGFAEARGQEIEEVIYRLG